MIDPHGLPVDDFWSHSLGKSWLRGVLVAIPPSVDTFQKSIKYWKRPTTSFENFIPARRCEKFSLIREAETNGCDKENRRETSEERKISGEKKKLKLSKRHETEEERRTSKEKKKQTDWEGDVRKETGEERRIRKAEQKARDDE